MIVWQPVCPCGHAKAIGRVPISFIPGMSGRQNNLAENVSMYDQRLTVDTLQAKILTFCNLFRRIQFCNENLRNR